MNIFDMPDIFNNKEILDVLHTSGNVRIERIISTGQSSGEGFFYDQDTNEWLVLLSGNARLSIEEREVELSPGDTLFLSAHTKHRILATSKDPPCIWLCVHYK